MMAYFQAEKILVADGEKEYRRRCKAELCRRGYEVLVAKNAEEALRLLRAEKFDLVVLDIRLPAEGGLDTLQWIVDTPDAPSVILTSNCHFTDESFLIWCADACILKSSDLGELADTIKRVLEKEPELLPR